MLDISDALTTGFSDEFDIKEERGRQVLREKRQAMGRRREGVGRRIAAESYEAIARLSASLTSWSQGVDHVSGRGWGCWLSYGQAYSQPYEYYWDWGQDLMSKPFL
eukprot:2240748-Pleurochrysis_carterae.AAC.2